MSNGNRACLPLVAALALSLAPPADAQTTAPFTYVDRVEGEIGFNAVPRRPMALSDDDSHLYAVNTQNSTVLDFTDDSGDPSAVFHVPRSPVSIAVWDDPSDTTYPHKLVVVCDGTYALVVLDAASGRILDLVELRDPSTGQILGEPADLLVDEAEDVAFVSCAAADAVLEVDLATGAPVRRFDLPAKDPVFMCFDEEGDVLVAPMFSGNDSGGRQVPDTLSGPTINGQHQGPTIVDFETEDTTGGLPDFDLFRCIRATGDVEPVTEAMGSVMFAVGLHSNGKIWQLNTDANNKDPNRQTEASIKGDIVQNRLSIVLDPGAGNAPATPTTVKNLDTMNGSSPYDPALTVGQPSSLAFVGTLGLITGLLTDNVMVVGASGGLLGEWDLPAGSIPRQVLYSDEFNLVFVYCWGTSKIESYTFTTGAPHDATLDLGYDPTPEAVREGRAIFYDASNSERNNASCASCHVEGRTDMLAWNLSKGPVDDKGPMVTQTLAGIEKLVPFHWRGEQQNGLSDFNPAFVNLLGAEEELSTEDFELFERFVFSIQNRPNPFQNQDRLVDDDIEPALHEEMGSIDASATNGQDVFEESCEVCHNFPTGTSNDIVGDGALEGEENPRRQFFKIAPFHDLYKKEQDLDKTNAYVDTREIELETLAGGSYETSQYPLLGAGFSHAGLIATLNEFVFVFFPALTAQEVADVTGFLFQWDQGVAPATYRAVLLDSTNVAEVEWLEAQADLRNCDVAAFGIAEIASTPTPMRWWYDRRQPSAPWVAEDTSLADETLAFFESQDPGSITFVALPVGAGRRFGVDFDGDDLFNGDEAELGTDPYDPDTDGDGWPDGHEEKNDGDALDDMVPSDDDTDPNILEATTPMVTGKVARINVETDEPCTVTVTYARTGGATQTKSTSEFVLTHSIVLDDLIHSNSGSSEHTYDGDVTVTDLDGNTDVVGLPDMPAFNQALPGSPPTPITTRIFNGNPSNVVIGDLYWGTVSKGLQPNGTRTITATAHVEVDERRGGPPGDAVPDVHVVARVFVDGVLSTAFTSNGTSTKRASFDYVDDDPNTTPAVETTTFTGLDGPFLFSAVTDSSGETTLRFSLTGLSLGDEVTLNVELVAEEATGSFSDFTVEDISRWNMPATPAPYRGLSTTM